MKTQSTLVSIIAAALLAPSAFNFAQAPEASATTKMQASQSTAVAPSQPQTFTNWKEALDAICLAEWGPPTTPTTNALLRGGPSAQRSSPNTVAVLGRAFIETRQLGKKQYENILMFEPATPPERPETFQVKWGNPLEKQVLERLALGDSPVILSGTFHQTKGTSHDGVNHWMRTEFAVSGIEWLNRQQAEEAAKLILNPAARQAFVQSVTPMEIAGIKLFLDFVSVHPNVRGAFESKILLKYRAFNSTADPIQLSPPTVRLVLAEAKVEAKKTSGNAMAIPAKGWADRDIANSEFVIYKPESSAAPGQKVDVEIVFTAAGGRTATRTVSVTTLKPLVPSNK